MEIEKGERWLVVRRPDGKVTMWDLFHITDVLVDFKNAELNIHPSEEDLASLCSKRKKITRYGMVKNGLFKKGKR